MGSRAVASSSTVERHASAAGRAASASRSLQCYALQAQLSLFITSFWIHRSDPRPYACQRALPTGTAQLVIDLSGDGLFVPDPASAGESRSMSHALMHGPYAQPFLVGTDRPTWKLGVNFAPGGAYPFFAPPVSELQNAHVPIDALWGAHASQELGERLTAARTDEERVQVVEQALLRRLIRPRERHPAVAHALRAFSFAPQGRAITRIAEVADEIGLSPGRLTRLFREEVGLTPKQHVRVQRFQCLLRRIRMGQPAQWARLAAECGYYDQAHLINEFQALAGVNPSVYLRDRNEQSPTYLILDGMAEKGAETH